VAPDDLIPEPDRVEIPPRMLAALSNPANLPRELKLGDRVYQPQAIAGAGHKAVVWRVTDRFGRSRAAKLATYSDYVDRSWEQEVVGAAFLETDPTFARVEDAGREEVDLGDAGVFDAVFFLEEWVDGVTLEDFLVSEFDNVDAAFLLAYVRSICPALELLRSQGLEHDDLHARNVMLSQQPGPDLRVRIVDLGSLKPLARCVKPMRDLDHLVDHLIAIYNTMVRRKSVARADRALLAEARELLDRMAEPDLTVALRDPLEVRSSFNFAATRARFVAQLPGGRAMTFPFEFISSEHISDDSTFLRLFAETPWLSKVAGRHPSLVTGPRGCGKSTLFRWLALRTQLTRPDPDLTRFAIAGFYISCSTTLEGRFSWLADADAANAWERELIHYFNLVIADEVFATLLLMRERQDDIDSSFSGLWHIGVGEEEALLGFLRDELQTDSRVLDGTSRLRQAISLIHRELGHTDIAVRRGERRRPLTTETFVADLSALLVALFPFFEAHRITFLLDDFTRRRVNEHVQRILNKVIWPRREHHFFKVSSEKDGAVLTDSTGKVLEESRELVPLDIGLEYISLADKQEFAQALLFAESLLDARLAEAAYEGRARNLIGDSDWGEAGSLARALRDDRHSRSAYHGLTCIADLCSGDISTLLAVFRRIFEAGSVKESTTAVVRPAVQHAAIRDVSANQVRRLRDHFPCGPEMLELVTAFGTLVGNILREGRLLSGGIVPTCPRIEVDSGLGTGEELVGETKQLFEELIRRAVFIEMEPGRSRRDHVQTLRWQMRRVYLPNFGAALSKTVALKLRPAEFKMFLEEPAQSCDHFWAKEPKADVDTPESPPTLFP
jgi:hypothetical protein